MAFIEWEEKFSVKNSVLDKQHKSLVDAVNQLHTAMAQGHGKDVTAEIFDKLVEYTKVHFQTEEKLFTAAGWEQAEEHIQEHDKLVEEVLQLRQDFQDGKVLISVKLLNFLKDWLMHHILEEDMGYSELLKD